MHVTPSTLNWAAGFLEGEGSFDLARKSPRVSAVQVQLEPLTRLQALFGGVIGKFSRITRGKTCTYHRWYVYGPRAAGVAMTVFPLLSPRRKGQASNVLCVWKTAAGRVRGVAGVNKQKTHCPKGHEYNDKNTYLYEGRRYCAAC